MPATETPVNSCAVVVHLADENDVLKDISGSAASANMDFTQDAETYTVFGSPGTQRMVCRSDSTLSMSVVYSTAADEGYDIVKQWWFNAAYRKLPRNVRIMVPDDSIGADDYQGSFYLTNLTIPLNSEQAGPIMVAVELAVNGEVTLSTVAT